MQHGDPQRHERIKGQIAHQRRLAAQLLDQRGVQRTPGPAEQQKAGHIAEAPVLHMDLGQVEGDHGGRHAHKGHGKYDQQGKGVSRAVPAEDRAAAAQIDLRQDKAAVPGIFIAQHQRLRARLLRQHGVAVQLGPHLLVARKRRIVIGVEHLVPQRDLQPVDRPPGGQGRALVGIGQAVVVQYQVSPALQHDRPRHLHRKAPSVLQPVPACRKLPYVFQGPVRLLPDDPAQGEPNRQQNAQHQQALPAPSVQTSRFPHLSAVRAKCKALPGYGRAKLKSCSWLPSSIQAL